MQVLDFSDYCPAVMPRVLTSDHTMHIPHPSVTEVVLCVVLCVTASDAVLHCQDLQHHIASAIMTDTAVFVGLPVLKNGHNQALLCPRNKRDAASLGRENRPMCAEHDLDLESVQV